MRGCSAILIIIFCIGVLSSCSSNGKIDDKNAVLVFANDDLVKIDDGLVNFKVSLPKQINNQSWFGSNNDNNQEIENYIFANQISKATSIWTGYRPGYSNRMVFSPIITGDKIYILDDKGNLYARDLSSYKNIWTKKLIDRWFVKDFSGGKISYFDNKIYVSTGYNLIFCVNAVDGEIVWSKTLASIPISAPISDGKQVFVLTNDNKTYALDALSGQINWVHSGILKATGILGSANPVSYKNYIISSYSSGEVYTLNKKSGEVGWVYDFNINKTNNSDFILNDVV